jgi:hypothetical protein
LGVKALIEGLPNNKEFGFLSGNLSVMDMVNSIVLPKAVRIFQNEEELIHHFGQHLVSGAEELLPGEKRRHDRLNSALPLEFKCRGAKGEVLEFRAIVTNLSESGLFAEYIDLEDVSRSRSVINPYELKMLDLKIKLANQKVVTVKGKVVRQRLKGDQVGIGIEFYHIDEENKRKLKTFLATQFNEKVN